MLYKSENYKDLYQKRYAKENCSIEDFDNREISDLMALFNLVWIDPVHFQRYPRLQELWNKQYNYTLEDRIEINKPIEKVTIYIDTDNNNEIYGSRYLFGRFNMDMLSDEVRIDGKACFRMSEDDAAFILENKTETKE